MSQTSAATATGSATQAEALLQTFARAGYTHARPPILQPAEPFLDLSGEDIRKSLYLTTDATGEELCLRPDLTIPVAREYLASQRAGAPAGRWRGDRGLLGCAHPGLRGCCEDRRVRRVRSLQIFP